MKYFHILLTVMILGGLSRPSVAQPTADTLSYYEQYQQELSGLTSEFKEYGFDLNSLIDDDRFEVYGDIDNRFKGSAERTTPTLEEYKAILDFEEKVEQGAQFLKKHSLQLQEAAKKYGVSKYIITAIIGIESQYGTVLGSHNPFNVYVSMAIVDYRADFAKAQLRELLEFVNRKQIDVFTLKSSYAGAMSSAQFIPYSLNKWWVGDNIFDMDNNIKSVANYLAYFKKRTDSIRTTVLRYNPSGLYADTILDLADAIEKETNRSAP
ncbi:MAG TPA: lytic murein transglycosylase [Fodinibius sp.]|nr:lytic murein transglycosylase [Fodinibius sp.]